MKTKKIVAIILALCVMFSITACSSSDKVQNTLPQPENQNTAATEGTEAVPAEDIVLNYYGRPDTDLERQIIADFEAENPGIKINYVELPSSSNDRLKTIQTVLQTGGTEMDVFAGDACWPSIFVSAGWVEPLDSYIDASVRDQYIDTMLTAYTINGQTYGLPFMADVCAMYYREDLLSKYGCSVPTSYDEIAAASQAIMEKEENSDLYGWGSIWVQNETLTCCFLSFYWALGGGDLVDENGQVSIDQAIAEEALTKMYDFIYTDKVSPEGMGSFDTNAMRNAVMAGSFIFTSDWLSGYSKYNNPETSTVAGNMKIAAMPVNGALGGWGVMVSNFSEHKDAAVKFALYRASYDAQKTALQMASIVPTITSFYDPATVAEGFEYLPEFLPALNAARPRGLTPFYAEISAQIQVETSAVVCGMRSPAEAAANIVNAANVIAG